MTDIELRELDAWIGVNVFGKKAIHAHSAKPTEGTEDDYFVIEWINASCSLPHYTTDPAAAMQVLEKCFGRMGGTLIGIARLGSNYCVCVPAYAQDFGDVTSAPTLPLAICLFAKQLFSK